MDEGERFNGATHLVGLALAIGASAVLIDQASKRDIPSRQLAGCLVFAATLIAVYASSVLYHCSRGRFKASCAKVDHCAIYLLIAGTYTPLALAPAAHRWGVVLGAGIWLFAFLGIRLELASASTTAPSVPRYLAMGWLGVLFAAPVVGSLSSSGVAWLLAGALLYSIGTLFYRKAERWRHAHGIWHLFVIGGSACHFATVLGLLQVQ